MSKKILKILLLFFMTSCIAFTVTRVIPGDARIAYLNTFNLPFNEENLRYIEREMGLNIPLWKQYYIWLKNIMRLDLGNSYVNGMDVYLYLKTSFIYTVKLMSFSLLFIVLTSFLFGVLSALKIGSRFEKIVKFFSLIAVSLPKFWLGFILIDIFGVKLNILPISGAYSKGSIILPAITLSLSYIGYYTQFIKSNLLDVLSKDFVKYARLRKVSEKRIIIKYAILNALTPIITSFGKTIGGLFGGATIVENIFAWPGLGSVIVTAIDGRDYPIIQGYIFLISIMFIFSTELSNFLCSWINPRLRGRER